MCSVLEAIRSEITTDVSWKNNAFVGFWLGVDVVPLKCKWSLHTMFLHHCTAAQIFFSLFFSCPYPVHIRPPLPPPIPPIPRAALYSWLTAFPGHFMLDKRHATADTRHRSSIGGSLFQRAMSLKSEVRWTNLQGNNVSANATCSNPASQSILNSQTNFFSFFFVWELSMILKNTYYT